jgi:hypothetical protein
MEGLNWLYRRRMMVVEFRVIRELAKQVEVLQGLIAGEPTPGEESSKENGRDRMAELEWPKEGV